MSRSPVITDIRKATSVADLFYNADNIDKSTRPHQAAPGLAFIPCMSLGARPTTKGLQHTHSWNFRIIICVRLFSSLGATMRPR